MAYDPIETKLAAARTRLILDKPFLGALVLRLPLEPVQEAEWCKATATDARHFYYNPEFIEALTLPETQFILAHEALHCALSHFARRQHRQKQRWDLACDLAINPLLVDEGLKAPPGWIVIDDYRGLTAEEIYPLTEENPENDSPDNHLYDSDSDQGGSGQNPTPPDQGRPPRQQREGAGANAPPPPKPAPPPLTPDEREALKVQWQQRLAGAAQQAMQAGKLSGGLARMVDHLLQPQLPWRNLLARYLSSTARDDYSYMRPSRRAGEFILPSLRSHSINLVAALDTSASIGEAEFREFLAEIDALKGQLRAKVTLLACDNKLAPEAPWVYEPWEECRLPPSLDGGGGTDFNPVFDWVRSEGMQPETLIYFTDADGKFPKGPPPYPVIWLVKGKLKTPWGERIQLN